MHHSKHTETGKVTSYKQNTEKIRMTPQTKDRIWKAKLTWELGELFPLGLNYIYKLRSSPTLRVDKYAVFLIFIATINYGPFFFFDKNYGPFFNRKFHRNTHIQLYIVIHNGKPTGRTNQWETHRENSSYYHSCHVDWYNLEKYKFPLFNFNLWAGQWNICKVQVWKYIIN